MSHSSVVPPLTARQRLELESVCDRFEADQAQGMAPKIANYLAGYTSPLAHALARELVILEMEYRRNRGEVPRREDYSEIPYLAENDLQEFFPSSDNVSKRIGRFDLIHVLGQGAFGTVWKAIDTTLGRPVAFKLAHANLVDQPERFLREARAVAQLRHPNIVRVLDVGEWQDQLFIVRELIEGQSLAQRLKNEELPPQLAAAWACTLARALAYSHENGCIHRDIKPENVLLDANDEPHLLDFGLAKFTTSQGSSTRHGEMLGTPAYMAPEQARGESRLADARTDVYSLGMVLYEMLAGQLPFRGSVELIIRQILDEEPPSPERFRAKLPPDLVTICLKCLEKEPTSRYPTAALLGDDLDCFLKGKPIQARPVSRLAKVYRWARRKPTIATLTGLLLMLSMGMVIGAIIWIYTLKTGWENEKYLRDQASLAAARAEAEAAHSVEVTTFLETVFAPTDPLGQLLGGSHLSAQASEPRELARRAAARIEGELNRQPRTQARLMDTLGNLLRSLGEFQDAERLLQKARTLRANLTVSQESWQFEAEIARNHFFMGWLRQAQGRYAESQQEYQSGLSIRQRLYGAESLPVAEIEFHMGWMNLENKQKEAAKEHLQRCLQLRQKLLPDGHMLILVAQMGLMQSDGQNLELTMLASNAEHLLGKELAGPTIALAARVQLDRQLGRHDHAKQGYAELITICQKVFGQTHPVTALLQGDYAGYLWDIGDYREAFPLIQQAIATGDRFASTHPHLNLARIRFAFELLMAGRWEESGKQYSEALKGTGLSAAYRQEILHGLIWTSLQTGKPDEALKYAQQAQQASEVLSVEVQAWSHYCLARMLTMASRPAEAIPHDQAALRLANEVPLDQCSALFLDRISIIFNRDGNVSKAEELLRLAISKEQKLRGDNHPRVADRMHGLGIFLMGKNRPEEAVPMLRKALQIRETRLPPDDARILETRRVVERLNDPI